MPAIPEFTVIEGRQAASGVRVQPSEEGIQTLQQGARNIGRLTNEQAQYTRQAGQDIGRGLGALGAGAEAISKQVEQHQTLQEISSMGPGQAKLLSDTVDQMHAAIQSNDPAAIQKFRDNLETQLDNWEGQANTPGARAHAITQVDQMRNHILGTMLPSEMAIAADHKTKTDLGMMANTFASISTNKPETLDASLAMMSTQIDALVANHTLTPGSAEELKGIKQRMLGQVASATINSVVRGNPDAGILSNPSAARQMVKKYGPYLSPEEQQHLLTEADAQELALKHQQDADEGRQNQIEKKAYNDKMADIFTGMMQPDGTLRVGDTTVHDFIAAGAMPGKTPGEVEAAAKMINNLTERAKSGKDVTSDPATLADLQKRALSGDLTPQQLYEAAPKLSQKDLSNTYTMMERINKAGPELHDSNQLIKQTLTLGLVKVGSDPTTGPPTPAGVKFQIWYNAAVAKAVRENKLDQFAVDLADKVGKPNTDPFWAQFNQPGMPNPGSGLIPGGTAATPPSGGIGSRVYNWLFETPK
jgi:hypothetical protein